MARQTKLTRRSLVLAGTLAGALTLGIGESHAYSFPEQPIRLIVPTDPGGSLDGLARIFQRVFDEMDLVDHTMAVINMAGAGGTIGTRELRDAEPNGYTIALWHDGLVTSKAMGVVDYDHTAFEIIGSTGFGQLGLGTAEDSRFTTFEEVLDYSRDNPGEVSVATNIGLPVHFIPMHLSTTAGVEWRYVQSGGGSRRYQSVIGGHTDISQFSVQEMVQFQEAGLRPLVMLTEERVPQLPDVPTARELGVDVVAVTGRIWLAPKGTPPERLEALREAFKAAMARDDVRQQMIDFGLEPTFIEPEDVLVQLDEALAFTLPLVEKARQIQQ